MVQEATPTDTSPSCGPAPASAARRLHELFQFILALIAAVMVLADSFLREFLRLPGPEILLGVSSADPKPEHRKWLPHGHLITHILPALKTGTLAFLMQPSGQPPIYFVSVVDLIEKYLDASSGSHGSFGPHATRDAPEESKWLTVPRTAAPTVTSPGSLTPVIRGSSFVEVNPC